jgi:predicted kinase
MTQNRNGKTLTPTQLQNTTNELPKGKLFYTIGLARSGKSSFAKRWAQGLEDTELEGTRCIVCRDDFRKALTGEIFNSFSENAVNALTKYAIQALLYSNSNVLIDETNTREESIYELLSIDVNAQYYLIVTDVGTCIQRAKDTNQPYLINPIQRMERNLQKLLTENGGLDNTIDKIRFRLAERKPCIIPLGDNV